MKLIASLTSPYARKIRIVLAERHQPFELVVDIPWNADTHVPDYNPLGKVPALVADDGCVYVDSPVIAEYIDGVLCSPLLIPAERAQAVKVKLVEALADGLIDAAVAIFLERKRTPDRQDSEWIARQFGKIDLALASLARQLGGSTWFHEQHLTLADIAVGCALGYLAFRFTEIGWRDQHPALAAFYDRLMTRESFLATVPPQA